jgi:hypothetical protein
MAPRLSRRSPSSYKGTRVEYSGPLFEKDLKRTLRENMRALVLTMAEDGAQLAKREFSSSFRGHGNRIAGSYTDAIEGRVQSLRGKPWALTSVVSSTRHLQMPGYKGYGLFLESGTRGAGKWGRATSFGGYWVYRRVANAVRRSSRIVRADLAKGLN